MKNSVKIAAVAAVAASSLLTACGNNEDTTPNRDADVAAACEKALAQSQTNIGLEAAKPLEDTTSITAVDGGWKMTGEVFALKDDSGAAGTASQVKFECTAKDSDGTIQAQAFITTRR
ncbi:hypothetical protein [Gordonia sp. SND2]|uniref:hypothetical protein n=1 Tax=Gordonia sp. SND2 TaxID=3388659 RepID=UPI00398BA61C